MRHFSALIISRQQLKHLLQSYSYNAVTPGPRLERLPWHEMKIGEWTERRVGGRSYIEMLQGKLSPNGNLKHGMFS